MNELPIKDIHLPDASFWWPLAPGWWLLGVMVILMVFMGPRFWRWFKHKPLRKLSLVELNNIRQAFTTGRDEREILSEISRLMRRTVMSYQGRERVAGLSGDAWIKALNDLPGIDNFSDQQLELLAYAQYRPDPNCDIDALLQSCENWFKSLPRGTAHASA